jgi:shikimate kinase
MSRDRPLVVVGLMGSGKTTVATLLAAALGRPLRDSDVDLTRWYGQTAAQYARRYGAEALHGQEAQALCRALAEDPPPVIAAAASVVEDPRCRAALSAAYVVWLDAPAAVLAERMRNGAHRPHFSPDLESMLHRQRERRSGWYASVADLTVDVSGIGPDEVAGVVLAALGRQ